MDNPYAAPETPMTSISSGSLASRWQRFVASFVDGMIAVPIYYVLQMAFGIEEAPPPSEEVLADSGFGDILLGSLNQPFSGATLILDLIVAIGFIAINFSLLKKGQTIGKKLLKIQVQHRDTGELLPVKQLITKRMLPCYVAGTLMHPLLGLLLLVDALCIFRSGRNTLHDDLARTKVVKL